MGRSVGEYFNATDGLNEAKKQPVMTLSYVQTGDIGADYVAGSEGQVKEIVYYVKADKSLVSGRQTFKYTDATYPTKPTEIVNEEV